MRQIATLIAAIAVLSPLGAVPAPPMHLQKTAPEQLLIEVVSVRAERVSNDSTLNIKIEAKVIGVSASASNVHAGQSITIEYLTRPPSEGSRFTTCATPQMPVLTKTRQYKAYLGGGNGAYYPAASWVSFE